MLVSHKNKKIYYVILILFFIFSRFLCLGEGKIKKRIYNDKLELIREFILENYPVNPEHYIQVETLTGLYQNFWDFGVTVGDLYAFEPPSEEEKVEPEYIFVFQITAEYELILFDMSKGKVLERLQKAVEELSKEKEINFESARDILIKMGAMYPLEKGEVVEKHDFSIVRYLPEEGSEGLKKYLLKNEHLWGFLGEGEPHIERMWFNIRMEDEPMLEWHVLVKIGKSKYWLRIEPFWGYIIGIEREWE